MPPMKKLVLILSFMFFAFLVNAQLSIDPLFEHIPARKFGANAVTNQCWDKDGKLWLTGDAGLICYNGYTAKIWSPNKNKTGPLSTVFRTIYIDKFNSVWLSYNDVSGITRFDITTQKFTHFLPDSTNEKSIPDAMVVRFIEDSKSNFWILTWGGGLVKMNRKAGNFFVYKPNTTTTFDKKILPYDKIKAMTELRDGRFLLGFFGENNPNAIPCYFDPVNQTFEQIKIDEILACEKDKKEQACIRLSLTIDHFIHVDKEQNLWFGTYCGLIHYNPKKKILKRISAKEFNNTMANLDNTRACLEDNNGILWISTLNKGLMLVDIHSHKAKYVQHNIKQASTISDNRISALTKGPDGNIWVSTGSGDLNVYNQLVQQFQILPWNEMSLDYTLQSEQIIPVNQLLVKNSREVFVSSEAGITVYDPKQLQIARLIHRPVNFRTNEGIIKTARIENFKFLGNNEYLFMKANNPVVYNETNETFTNVSVKAVEKELDYKALSGILFRHQPKKDKFYLIRSYPALLFEFDLKNKKVLPFMNLGHFVEGDFNAGVKVIDRFSLVLPNGNWLVSAIHGAYNGGTNTNRFFIVDPKAKKSTLFGYKDSDVYFPDSSINAVYVDPLNKTWIGTENGLYSFDPVSGKSKYISKDLGIANKPVRAMSCDKKGIYWLLMEKEIVRWDPSTMNVFVFDNTVGVPNGTVLPSVAQMDEEGNIYAATINGVLMFNPSKIVIPQDKPQVFLDLVAIKDDTLNLRETHDFLKGNYALSWNQNFLNMEFSSSQIHSLSQPNFYYRLIGLDSSWQTNGTSNHIRYTNLSYGEYILEVRIENMYGIQSEVLQIPITIRRPFWFAWWFYVLVVLLVVLLFYWFIKYRERSLQKQREMLERKVEERTAEVVEKAREITHQKDIIEQKNKELTDSIHYAERIQRSILPDEATLAKNLPEHLVMFRPKDIVSGDFYWHARQQDSILWAVVDCTGHGVPGGFMSMLGAGLLNQIVNEELKLQPDLVLNELRNRVIIALKQTGVIGENRDGMDISLCRYMPKENKIQFAGANNSLYVIRNGELMELKPDKQPIGIYVGEKKSFDLQEMIVEKNDLLYMTSDGYADQFGGDKGKKFKSSNFEKLLQHISRNSIREQYMEIEHTFEQWKGEYEQLDDVCVFGVRI